MKPFPNAPFMSQLHPVVAKLAEKLQTTEHNVWFSLFAIGNNSQFNLEMRDYLKDRHPETGAKRKEPK